MSRLFPELPIFPVAAVDSIYQAYPRKTQKAVAVVAINRALARICSGEIDGQQRSAAEAITFLRNMAGVFRRECTGKPKEWIPHPSTWMNQSRYLRQPAPQEQLPPRLLDCIAILACYPKMPGEKIIGENPQGFQPALKAINDALERVEKVRMNHHSYRVEAVSAEWLLGRVQKYAAAVQTWPEADLIYVPNPKRFFEEQRYEQPESSWQRKPINGYESEREQVSRIVQ